MKRKLFFLTTFLSFVFINSASWAANSNLIGGDRDNKGCISSAGYTWSYLDQGCTSSITDFEKHLINLNLIGESKDNKGCTDKYVWSYLMKQCVRTVVSSPIDDDSPNTIEIYSKDHSKAQIIDVASYSIETQDDDSHSSEDIYVIYSKDNSKAEIIGIGGVLDAVNITEKDGSKILFQNKMGQIKIIENDENSLLLFDIGGKRFATFAGC